MFVVRAICPSDFSALQDFAAESSLGMLSLPNDRIKLQEKLNHTLASFKKAATAPVDEIYLFVVEETTTQMIAGMCGIYAKTGIQDPLYFFRIETHHPKYNGLPKPDEIKILHPCIQQEGPSELCSLFVHKEHRKERLGELLSLSRFLFMADHPHRFDTLICARLRGFINKQKKTSPFWEGLGKHFLPLSFEKAFSLQLEGTEYIAEFLPEHPIYTNLLTKQTQYVIQKTHLSTRPALKMLKKEGFKLSQLIDVIDGGPVIQASISDVRSVKKSRLLTVSSLSKAPIESRKYLISNTKLDFRCCYGNIELKKKNTITLTTDVAEALQINLGSQVRVVTKH